MSLNPRTWRQRAEALARVIPKDRLHPRVLEWTKTRAGAALGPWCLAVSGGADSLALALLVWAHWPSSRDRLFLLHFDHRQRGRGSGLKEAAFSRSLAKGLGIPCKIGSWTGAKVGASEALLRKARLEFFDNEMHRLGSRALWLGHQMEDIAETQFMRLARGSGTAGLAVPRPVQAVHASVFRLRPLLALSKRELQASLEGIGIPWIEDRSNFEGKYLRNRIRHAVIPAWIEAVNDRDPFAGAALARERLEEDDAALEAWLDSLHVMRRGPVLDTIPLQEKPVALWRRALHRWLLATPYRGDLSRQGFEVLLGILRSRSMEDMRISLGRAGFAVLRKGFLRYAKDKRNSPEL